MIAETCWFVRKRTDSKKFLDNDDPVSEVECSESLTMDDDCFERGADPFRSELESLPEKQDEWTVRISLPEDWW